MTRALLLIAGWIGRASALWLPTSRRPLGAEVVALRERLEKLRAENQLLRGRLLRIEPHSRPRFTPWERLLILLHRSRYGLSIESTARAFVITGQTVMNWLAEVESGVARLVQARRPMNALPDLVRELTWFLKRQWPWWGTRRIAGILARLGLRASRTSVQRLLRRPPPWPSARGRVCRPSPLRATFPGHVWVVDFTHVKNFFRSVVGCMLDAFSRKVLALRVWSAEPDAAGACLLLGDALRKHAKPRWVVSDRGRQFRSLRFRRSLGRWSIRRRYAAVGDANLGRIDRFWRAMKEEYATGLLLFHPLRSLEKKLQAYVRWHAGERPHEGLKLRTPTEVHGGRPVRPSQGISSATIEIRFLDLERRLPAFRLQPAA